MRKSAFLLLGLAATLGLAMPASTGGEKKALKSMSAMSRLLTAAAQNVDTAAASVGVDLRFSHDEETATGAPSKRKRKKKKMSETAEKLEEVRGLTTALFDHASSLRERFRAEKRKRNARQAKRLMDSVKDLKEMLDNIHRDKPQRDLWALLEAEKRAEKVHKRARAWSDYNTHDPG